MDQYQFKISLLIDTSQEEESSLAQLKASASGCHYFFSLLNTNETVPSGYLEYLPSSLVQMLSPVPAQEEVNPNDFQAYSAQIVYVLKQLQDSTKDTKRHFLQAQQDFQTKAQMLIQVQQEVPYAYFQNDFYFDFLKFNKSQQQIQADIDTSIGYLEKLDGLIKVMINQNFEKFLFYFQELAQSMEQIESVLGQIRRQKECNRVVMQGVVARLQNIAAKKRQVLRVQSLENSLRMLQLLSQFPPQIDRLRQVKSYGKALQLIEYFENLQEEKLKNTKIFQKCQLEVIESKLLIQEQLYRQFTQDYLAFFGEAYQYRLEEEGVEFVPVGGAPKQLSEQLLYFLRHNHNFSFKAITRETLLSLEYFLKNLLLDYLQVCEGQPRQNQHLDCLALVDYLLSAIDMSAFDGLLRLLLQVVTRCLHRLLLFTDHFFHAYVSAFSKPTRLLQELFQNSLEVRKALLDKLQRVFHTQRLRYDRLDGLNAFLSCGKALSSALLGHPFQDPFSEQDYHKQVAKHRDKAYKQLALQVQQLDNLRLQRAMDFINTYFNQLLQQQAELFPRESLQVVSLEEGRLERVRQLLGWEGVSMKGVHALANLVYLVEECLSHTQAHPDFLLEVFMKGQMVVVATIEKTQESVPCLTEHQTTLCINTLGLLCQVFTAYSLKNRVEHVENIVRQLLKMARSTAEDMMAKQVQVLEEEVRQRAVRLSDPSSESAQEDRQCLLDRVVMFSRESVQTLSYPVLQENMVQQVVRVLVNKYFVIFRFAHDPSMLQQQSQFIDALRTIPVLRDNIYFQEQMDQLQSI